MVENHPQVELRCIEDCDNEIARRVGVEVGCDYCSGWESAMSRSDVHCVVVSVPNKCHHDQVCTTLKRIRASAAKGAGLQGIKNE